MKDVDVLKIDVPDQASPESEWKLTKVAKCAYYYKEFENPDAYSRFNDGKTKIVINEKTLEKDSDIHTFAVQKLVSVTPISVDISSRVDLEQLKNLYI
jgi:5'-nucleotidase